MKSGKCFHRSLSQLVSLQLPTPLEIRTPINYFEFRHLSELSPSLTHTGLLTHMPALSPTNPTHCPQGLALLYFLPPFGCITTAIPLCPRVLFPLLNGSVLLFLPVKFLFIRQGLLSTIFSINPFRICQSQSVILSQGVVYISTAMLHTPQSLQGHCYAFQHMLLPPDMARSTQTSSCRINQNVKSQWLNKTVFYCFVQPLGFYLAHTKWIPTGVQRRAEAQGRECWRGPPWQLDASAGPCHMSPGKQSPSRWQEEEETWLQVSIRSTHYLSLLDFSNLYCSLNQLTIVLNLNKYILKGNCIG